MTRKTTGQRKVEAILKHADKFYDYSGWPSSVTAKSYVTSVCPVHGSWEHLVKTHVNNGTGCIKCGDRKRGNDLIKGRSYYIERARQVHGDKYDYSLWLHDISGKSKVLTICKQHGRFCHGVSNHIYQSNGCPECNGTIKKSVQEWKLKCSEVHDGKYDYSLWPNDITTKTKVTSLCPDHGGWAHNVDNHSRGNGCPVCARSFSEKQCCVYILKAEGLNVYKIGTAINPLKRVSELNRRQNIYSFDLVTCRPLNNTRDARAFEYSLHSEYESKRVHHDKYFDGFTELFEFQPQEIHNVIFKLTKGGTN